LKTIRKKIWPEYFAKVQNGKKTFELRLANFECSEGDTLILEEWDPKTKEYTGRKIEKKVGFVVKTKGLPFWTEEEIEKFGYQVISLL
jgi:hypothetical protein